VSSDPNDAKVLPKIQECLSRLADLTTGPMGMPFAGPGGGSFPDFLEAMSRFMDFEEDFYDDEDDDDDDEDDAGEGRPSLPGPAPRQRAKGGPKRKKKK
jgi:hypothetical protein